MIRPRVRPGGREHHRCYLAVERASDEMAEETQTLLARMSRATTVSDFIRDLRRLIFAAIDAWEADLDAQEPSTQREPIDPEPCISVS